MGFVEKVNSRHTMAKMAEEHWGAWQKSLAKVIRNPIMEYSVGTLVILSFVLMIMETDLSPNVPRWLDQVNLALLATYSAEMGLRLFIFRLAFFYSYFNIFELFIIGIDLLALVFGSIFESAPNLAPLRLCRTLRLARGAKLASRFPQLTLIVKGIIRGISASLWGVGLLLIILTVFSVMAVQFVQPVNERLTARGDYSDCSRCPNAFGSVRSAMLTFIQQIIAGDSWGLVTIPIIEEAPWTAIFFGVVFISIHVTIMNVILAVIVDTALKASEEEKQAETFREAQALLVDICAAMDADGSGDLTEEEIMAGFDENEDFRDLLLSMDIKKENMHMIYGLLDQDQSGTVNYHEFIAELLKMKKHDSHSMLVFVKHYISDIRKDVRDQLRGIKAEMRHLLKDGCHDDVGPTMTDMTVTSLNSPGAFRSELEDEKYMDSCRGPDSPQWMSSPKERPPHPEKVVVARPHGSWCETASLRELGEELRNLRKVISDELLLSMKEMNQKAQSHAMPFQFSEKLDRPQPFQPNHLSRTLYGRATGRALSEGGLGQAHIKAQEPLKAPSERKLPPAASPVASPSKKDRTVPWRDAGPSEKTPTSSWALQSCCALQNREATAVVHTLKTPPYSGPFSA